MAKQKSKKHHSRPHGVGLSYAQRLARQRAFEKAALKQEEQNQ